MFSEIIIIFIVGSLIAFVSFLREYDKVYRPMEVHYYPPSPSGPRLTNANLCGLCYLSAPRFPRHFSDLSQAPSPAARSIRPYVAPYPINNEFHRIDPLQPPLPGPWYNTPQIYFIPFSSSTPTNPFMYGQNTGRYIQFLPTSRGVTNLQLLSAPTANRTMSFNINPPPQANYNYYTELLPRYSSPFPVATYDYYTGPRYPNFQLYPSYSSPTAGRCTTGQSFGSNISSFPQTYGPTAGRCSVDSSPFSRRSFLDDEDMDTTPVRFSIPWHSPR